MSEKIRTRTSAALPCALAIAMATAFGEPARAAYVGAMLVEDAALNAQASNAIGESARVLRLYAAFDGPGDVGDLFTFGIDNNMLVAEADIQLAPGLSLFQSGPPFGSDTAVPRAAAAQTQPDIEWDTFVSIGVFDTAQAMSSSSNTVFAQDWFENGFTSSSVRGSWFTANPPVSGGLDGAAGQDGLVFLAQLTVLGAGSGGRGLTPPVGGVHTDINTQLLTGSMRLFTQQLGGGAIEHSVAFIPAPGGAGAIAFGAACLAARRRRRS